MVTRPAFLLLAAAPGLVAVLVGATACPSQGPFACQGDEQCTLRADGMCHEGGECSYPDSGCPSGRRFSETAGERAGQCVDAPPAECGNGVVEGDEECDDARDPVCNDCTSDCRLAGRVQWSVTHDQHGFADFFDSPLVTPDGDVVVVGRTNTGTSIEARDRVVVRYDAAGTQRWLVTEPRPGRDDLNCVVTSPEGELVAAGVQESAAGPEELWVGRYDQDGMVELLAYGDIEARPSQAQDCAFTTDGRLVVVGMIDGPGDTTSYERWDRLVLDDVLGTPRMLDVQGSAPLTDARDIAFQVASGPAGALLVAGNVTLDASSASERWLARFDAAGDWVDEYVDGGAGQGEEEIFGVVVDGDRVLAAGSKVFNAGGTERTWIAALTDDLAVDWEVELPLEPPAKVTDLALDADGNLLVTANVEGMGVVAQLDPSGACQWLVEAPGGAARLSGIAVAPDGSVVVTGADAPTDEPTTDAVVASLRP